MAAQRDQMFPRKPIEKELPPTPPARSARVTGNEPCCRRPSAATSRTSPGGATSAAGRAQPDAKAATFFFTAAVTFYSQRYC